MKRERRFFSYDHLGSTSLAIDPQRNEARPGAEGSDQTHVVWISGDELRYAHTLTWGNRILQARG